MTKTVKRGVVATARAALGLTQPEFGIWLGNALDKSHVPWCRISEWERGVRSPRRNVRDACAPVAALGVAKRIEAEHPTADVAAQWITDALA